MIRIVMRNRPLWLPLALSFLLAFSLVMIFTGQSLTSAELKKILVPFVLFAGLYTGFIYLSVFWLVVRPSLDICRRDISESVQKEKKTAIAAAIEAERKKGADLEVAFRELKEKTERLERFQRITIDRELAQIRLKREINALLERLGEKQKYKVPLTEEEDV